MMTPEMQAKLKRSLITHEGWKNFPYVDTVGKITIGCGYNLTDRGIGDDWIEDKRQEDAFYFYDKLCQFPWYKDLTSDRQVVLIDMAFMGWLKFITFKKMINALSIHDYKAAAMEMLDSKWALQVKSRAVTLAQAMLIGIYDI